MQSDFPLGRAIVLGLSTASLYLLGVFVATFAH